MIVMLWRSIIKPVHVFLLSLLLSACALSGGLPAPGGRLAIDHLALAENEVANFGKEVVLTRVGSRYAVAEGNLIVEDNFYLFVSTDGAASYYLVRIYTDGRINSGPVAGRAIIEPVAYDFAENRLTERDAIDLAWKRYGTQLVEKCGGLRWIDVAAGTGESQFWSVGSRSGGTLSTIFIDAISGEVLQMDDINCG